MKTKREVVELGLRTLIRLRHQADIRSYRGDFDPFVTHLGLRPA